MGPLVGRLGHGLGILEKLQKSLKIRPGANPTIVIYNASVVNFYNAMGSLARFENKNILFYFVKRSSLLQRWRCSCKLKNRRSGSLVTLLVAAS
jgi:hypothetical protein